MILVPLFVRKVNKRWNSVRTTVLWEKAMILVEGRPPFFGTLEDTKAQQQYCVIKINYDSYEFYVLTYLASACMKMPQLSKFSEEPMMQTISPYSCMICNISLVALGVQSVNKETSKGTLSISSI